MSNAPTCEKPRMNPEANHLPPWKVILHNDDVNKAEYVVEKIREIVRLEEEEAVKKVLEAHETGCSLLKVTHQEKAEFFAEQLKSCNITATAEKE